MRREMNSKRLMLLTFAFVLIGGAQLMQYVDGPKFLSLPRALTVMADFVIVAIFAYRWGRASILEKNSGQLTGN